MALGMAFEKDELFEEWLKSCNKGLIVANGKWAQPLKLCPSSIRSVYSFRTAVVRYSLKAIPTSISSLGAPFSLTSTFTP